MKFNEAIQKELNTDPLAQAEQLTGKSYKTDKQTSLLGLSLHLEQVQNKRALLELNGDTHFGQTIPEYVSVLESLSFKEVYQDPFTKGDRSDTHFIYWHSSYSILLQFDSYGDLVNGGHFYYNVRFPPGKRTYNLTSSGRCLQHDPIIWSGNHDCREAVKHHINNFLRAGCTFLPTWKHNPIFVLGYFPWDTLENIPFKTKSAMWNASSLKVWNSLPREVRDATQVCKEEWEKN